MTSMCFAKIWWGSGGPSMGLRHEPKATARALASYRAFLAECLT